MTPTEIANQFPPASTPIFLKSFALPNKFIRNPDDKNYFWRQNFIEYKNNSQFVQFVQFYCSLTFWRIGSGNGGKLETLDAVVGENEEQNGPSGVADDEGFLQIIVVIKCCFRRRRWDESTHENIEEFRKKDDAEHNTSEGGQHHDCSARDFSNNLACQLPLFRFPLL